MKVFIVLLFTITACDQHISSNDQFVDEKVDRARQERIIEEHFINGALRYDVYSRERQEELDKGLAKDSTIAYLWQQKAMPLFKQAKYEVGMDYIDKAVKYDPEEWQDYRAFIKCIFAKTYREAIKDFEECKVKYGYVFVMDHSYDFYIGLSHLQLDEFEKAEEIFAKDYKYQLSEKGADWIHHLDLFYFGISRYEQKNYHGAIELFDLALARYPEFSEAQIFKATCLRKLGQFEESNVIHKEGEINGRKGYTINEDNVIYERYPYQIRW